MNRSIFGLGTGTAAIALFAALGLTAPTAAQAGACNGTALPDFGLATSAPLQGVLDSHTAFPAGASSVNVASDCFSDGSDTHWAIGGSGGSISTIMVEIAAFAGTNKFGIWDAANPSNTVELFDGAAGSGNQVLVGILADGSVTINFTDTGIDFAGNKFGYYLDATLGNGSADGFFYSDTSLNADLMDHMYSYQGQGDSIQIMPHAVGQWGPNEYLLAWEDLIGPCKTDPNAPTDPYSADCDYTDFVILVASVNSVPEPASLAIVGIGLLGLGAANRRRIRKVR